MDYAKKQVSEKLLNILNMIDEEWAKNVDTDSDLLNSIYEEIEEAIDHSDCVGFEEDDFEVDSGKIMMAKEYLIKNGYDFANKEVFTPYPVIIDPVELMHVNYLKLCGYHFHEFED